ncbi:hypothetical protein BDV18DRAFT_162739 [Aspergillus unguis]
MANSLGNRLLSTLVDEAAQSTPGRLFGIIPKGQTVSDGFREVTFDHLARGVGAMAWWIEENIGKTNGSEQEAIAYMGANDMRYYIFILACAKTGHEPFLPSTRLSDEAYEHVLNATMCQKMVYTPETQRRTMEIKTFRPDTLYIEAPSISRLIDNEVKPYPLTKDFESMKNRIAFTIHSSGTTGMPKPVPLTHGFLAAWDKAPDLIPSGRKSSFYNDLIPGDLVLAFTPNFHLMGLLALIESIFHGKPFAAPPDGPLSVQVITDTIHATKPIIAMIPPSVLEQMSHDQSALDALRTVRYVCLGGAPLAPETGLRVRQYTKLRTVLGSSEIGLLDSFAADDEEDWNSFEWIPAYGVDMRHVGESLYELVIVRNANSTYQGIFHTFPHLNEYHTKDLFVQTARNSQRWAYHGRLDDVIVLSNGEKLNPVTLEKIVEGHPSVFKALVVGEKRFQSALIIQPTPTGQDIDEKEFIDSVWPTIQRANETVPKYGRVLRSHIRLASPEKPFKLTPKGTTQRRAVNNDYKEEIDAIYASAAENEVENLPSVLDQPNITQWVHGKIAALLQRPDIKDSEDFYAAGLDSLQTVQLATTLGTALATTITQQQIYAHPTIGQLAGLLVSVLNGGGETSSISRADRIANLVAKYTDNLPSPREQPPTPENQTAILTGSTGSLGTYLLNVLLQDPTTSKVYCLNRSDAQARQITSFQEKGLDASPLTNPDKVEFLTTNLGQSTFGLEQSQYNALLETVTMVIHNAWTVNFNHPVESFQDPHIRSIRNFVDFSLQSKYRAHIAFVSSVSTIGAWKPEPGVDSVPEVAFETPSPVLEQGYGESKHVSERICLEASKRSGVPTSILRVGQIAGPTTTAGLWNPHEWVPILLKTSGAIGLVPDELGGFGVDWIPVDTLATIILEVLQTRLTQPNPNAFFHLTNPVKNSWSSLLPSIQSSLSNPVTPVAFPTWISTLESIKYPSEDDVTDKPALKLLQFFRALASGQAMGPDISTLRAQKASASMAGLKGVDGALMENWIKQWGF